MLTPPDGLSEKLLIAVLAKHWRLEVASIVYRALGFGSHHWEVVDSAGATWFVTVDELRRRRQSLEEPLDATVERLRHALTVALGLRARGYEFVVAPVASRRDEPVVRAKDFAIAVYPFVTGTSFDWGAFSSMAHRQAVLEMVVAVHEACPAARQPAHADEYAVPNRDELEAVLDGTNGGLDGAGPYAGPMTRLVGRSEAAIRVMLDHYDELAGLARATTSRSVLTHGEPHPGNTMLADDGWRLIDWDTALVAPPERDLWMLDPGDGSVLAAYAAATGVEPVAGLLELYRIRWDLTDLGSEVSRFLLPHEGTAEDEKAWQILVGLVGEIGA
ncbi:MAG: phosphotransferase [Streptosporangiaceae bacterium]